jgi:tRNA dimethylallyltransferase
VLKSQKTNWIGALEELTKNIAFVFGSTGSGKSRFALEFSKRIPIVLMNADSVQIFSHMQIGSNSPSQEDLLVCPHYFYGIRHPGQEFTAGDYSKLVTQSLSEITSRVPVIVGGSGFYIQALERGMYKNPEVTQMAVDEVSRLYEEGGNQLLFEKLKTLDPISAEKIHMSDTYRLKRAMNVCLSTGRAWSALREEFMREAKSPLAEYRKVKIGLKLNRSDLREVIEERTEDMLRRGLVEETKDLIEKFGDDCKALGSVGYKESVDFIKGDISSQELCAMIVKSTMALAKRQMTWFNRDPEVKWFDARSEWSAAQDFMFDQLSRLKNNT